MGNCTSGAGGAGGGGAGEYGGGMEGKNTTTAVKSSHPLTDYIGRGGSGFANEIMSTRDENNTAYCMEMRNIYDT